MAHVVVLGSGLGGTITAYEMKDKLRRGTSETFYEKLALDVLGINTLKEVTSEFSQRR